MFLDTYAIIEIDKDNPSYKRYILDSEETVTTVFNLMEVYFVYLKKFGKKEANEIYAIVKEMVVPVDDDIIKEAAEFKLLHQKKRLSFTDCIGYITSLKLNAKFVTGDYAFKGMENVDFVK